MALNMGSAIAYLELDTSKFRSGFSSAINDLKVFQSKGATAEQKLKGLSGAFSTIGGGLTKGVTLPLVGIGTASVGVASKFETAMSQVAATMGITSEQIKSGNKDFEALQQTALEMGATTKYTASEAAEGLNILAQAGLTAEESITAIPTVLNLASAGAMSLDSAATYVTATVKGFGDSMENAQKYADLMAKGATLANTNVSGLGEAMSGVSATANNYGQDVDSVTLSLLRLAEQNVTGSEAAMALSRAMMDIYTPTSTAKKVLDELGISAYDSSGNAKDFNDIVEDLTEAFSGMSDEEANAYKNQVFTTYGLSAFNKMTSTTTDTLDKFKTGLQDATGSAAQQAETQLDNLKGSLTLLKSALEGAGISIGQRLSPYVRKLADFINDLVTKFNNLSDAQKDMIVKIGLVVAAIGPVMLIITKVISLILVFKKVISIFTKVKDSILLVKAGYVGLATQMGGIPSLVATLSKAFSLLISPIGLVVVAIVGLVTAFVVLWNKSEEFRNFWLSLWDNIKSVVSNAVNVISTFFNETLPNVFDTVGQKINDFGQMVFDFFTVTIPEAVSSFVSSIGEAIQGFIDFFTITIPEAFSNFVNVTLPNTINSIITLFNQLPYYVGYAIGVMIGHIILFAQNIYNFATVQLPQYINGIVKWFSQLPSKIWTWLNQTIQKLTEFAVQTAQKSIEAGQKFITNIVTWFTQLPSKVRTFLTKTIQNVTTWASEMATKAVETGQKFISSVVEGIRELPSKIQSVLSNVISGLSQWVSNMGQKGIQAATELRNGVVNTAKAISSQMLSVGANIVNGVWRGIQNAKATFLSNVRSFFKGIVDGAKSALGIHSPSKVFDTQIGQNMVKGVIQGVNKQKKNAKKSAKELAKLYVDAGNDKLKALEKQNKYSLQLEVNFWAKMLKQYKKGTKAYKAINKELKEAKAELNKEMKKLDKEYLKSVVEVQKKLNEDIQKVMDEYDSAVQSRAEQIASQMSLFSKFESKSENTTSSLLDNLQSQVNGLKEWDKALDSLKSRGISEGLLEELEEMGTDSLADIQLLVSMTDSELNKYVQLWEEKQRLATERAIKEVDKESYMNEIKSLINEAGTELDKLEAEYVSDLKELGVGVKDTSVKIGSNIITGMKRGIKSKYPSFLEYVKKQMNKVTTTAKKTLGIASPSKVFASIGGFMAEGLGNGFKKEISNVNKDVETQLNNLANVNVKQINLNEVFEPYKNVFNEIGNTILSSINEFVLTLKNSFDIMLEGFTNIKDDMKEIVDMLSEINELNNATFKYVEEKREQREREQKEQRGQGEGQGGGDTFNFYNTKADPYEYARQMKRAKKELLYGL